MGDLSPHFSRHEFECHGNNCCDHSAPINPDLIQALEHLRDLLSKNNGLHEIPILILSGFRCQKHNELIGSFPKSQHTLGLAADIIAPPFSPLTIALIANYTPWFSNGGIGAYDSFVHLDIRHDGPARW